MEYFLQQYVLGLTLNPILHYLIDTISDINPEKRFRPSVWVSAFLGYIFIIINIYVLTLSVFRFVLDFMLYCSKYKNLTKEERAKKYQEVLDQSLSFESQLADLPMNREALFKKAITQGSYCWKLNRFMGRFEDDGGKVIAGFLGIESSRYNFQETKEHKQKKIHKDFKDLLK